MTEKPTGYVISKLSEERDRFEELLADFIILEEPPEEPELGSKLFFYHYSKKIPKELHQNYLCVGFHMTDLPFGRGGSPIQNLISMGYTETMLTSFKIEETLDTGKLYYKSQISLDGTVLDILLRGIPLAVNMITVISQIPDLVPMSQRGEPTYFKQLSPSQSEIRSDIGLNKIYDHIRMLDGPGYPPAFIEHGLFRYEFSEARLRNKVLTAKVTISPVKK